jgi:hypothetical protein
LNEQDSGILNTLLTVHGLGVFADAIVFTRSNAAKELLRFPDCLLIQGVIGPFALLSGLHESAIAKDLHVVGKRRLRDMKLL